MSNIDELIEKTPLENMLQFETQMFLDIIHNDGLVIAAKGLLLDQVLLNIFKVYNDPGNLVIVLNCSEHEEKHFMQKLASEHVHRIVCTSSIAEREEMYLSGGIHFVTTRILVVDMLKKRIPIEKITGFVVLRAHQVLESCQEAFVLRLFRQHNKVGFIKAFTNSPQSFTVGFGHVERIMRTLFVKELYIWPRFHSLVNQSLKEHAPLVIELHIPMSDTMGKIQTCVLDLMNITVKELKRINKTLELQEITVENCLTKKFHKILQNQLDCVWNQLSSKSRQLIADLKTLRHLIVMMFYADSVTFYSILSGYRSKEYAQTSTWVLHEPAELLFTYSRQLVYTKKDELNPEHCPKWKTLEEILKVEIPSEIRRSDVKDNNVLILCQDTKTCFQLNQFLAHGPHRFLFQTALKRRLPFKTIHENLKNCKDCSELLTQHSSSAENPKKPKLSKEIEITAAENDDEEREDFQSTYILTMSLSSDDATDVESSQCVFEPFPEMENMDLTQLCSAERSNPTVLIQTFKNAENFHSFCKTLEEIQPRFIVMYHSDMSAVRQIELYEARRNKERPLKIYFLIHAGTVEEQSYLTSLRREKEAFEYLIETKSVMVVPDDQDGKSDECLALQREFSGPETSTRQGGKKDDKRKLIIVDMREFRSELPALIHKRGIEIEPVTITIGDYILTPDICVERKSVSDLIGSLNSGRLYQQCTQMTRYYSKPILLIEFDQNKPFSWQRYMVSEDSNNFGIQQKLLLLTLHFPKLKLVWSPSPYASAQLFEELKEKKDEPNVQYAASIGSEKDVDLIETKYNTSVYDFVQKLPGVTSKNIDAFLRNMGSMDGVVSKSEEELKEVLGNPVDTADFYKILHEEQTPKESSEKIRSKSGPRSKFKYVKKK